MNWLPVNERMHQRICVLGYNFFNNTSPSYMSDIFIPKKVVKHTRNSEQKFEIPFRRTNMGQNTLSYSGPVLWNNLSIDIKLAKSRNDFKHKMKLAFFKSA